MLNIVRPQEGRILGGVCAGIADRYGWRPRTVRMAFLVSCVLPGPQFLLYLAAWILLPEQQAPFSVIDVDEVSDRGFSSVAHGSDDRLSL